MRPKFDNDSRIWKGPEDDRNRVQRQARFDVAKHVYAELCQDRLEQFQEAQDRHLPRSLAYPKSREELSERLAEIEELKVELAGRRLGIGTGQNGAITGVEVNQCLAVVDDLAKAEQDRVAEERYEAGLEIERKNQKRLQQKRKKMRRIQSAKHQANRRESTALKKYVEKMVPPPTPLPNPLTMEIRAPIRHYPRIARVSAIGEIPVNVDALVYQQTLNGVAKQERKKQQNYQKQVTERTKRAADHQRCCKMKRNLQDDLNGIYQFEVNEQLRPENLRKPASVIPMCTTYLVEDKYQKRDEKISLHFRMPEAPKPRTKAPQPVSLHQTSPNVTDDER
jgi:hypothetical protein